MTHPKQEIFENKNYPANPAADLEIIDIAPGKARAWPYVIFGLFALSLLIISVALANRGAGSYSVDRVIQNGLAE